MKKLDEGIRYFAEKSNAEFEWARRYAEFNSTMLLKALTEAQAREILGTAEHFARLHKPQEAARARERAKRAYERAALLEKDADEIHAELGVLAQLIPE